MSSTVSITDGVARAFSSKNDSRDKARFKMITSIIPSELSANSSNLRDRTIDATRGLATFFMIFSHYVALMMSEESQRSMELRMIGSFAAPLFIILSGIMVGLAIDFRGATCQYFLNRGIILIFVSSIVVETLFFESIPFGMMEVLTLIGLSLPLTAIFHRKSFALRYVITILIFTITPWLQIRYKYRGQVDPYDVKDMMNPNEIIPFFTQELPQTVFIDGSFPLFPWIGFSFAGSLFSSWRYIQDKAKLGQESFKSFRLWIGLLVLSLGALFWYHHPSQQFIRFGCGELFYPPTLGYCVTAFGVFLTVISFIDFHYAYNKNQSYTASTIFGYLTILGKRSLFIYLFHYVILYRFAAQKALKTALTGLGHVYLFTLIVVLCISAAAIVNSLSSYRSYIPFILRILLGY
jgi:uncharacterized membrane protein